MSTIKMEVTAAHHEAALCPRPSGGTSNDGGEQDFAVVVVSRAAAAPKAPLSDSAVGERGRGSGWVSGYTCTLPPRRVQQQAQVALLLLRHTSQGPVTTVRAVRRCFPAGCGLCIGIPDMWAQLLHA